MVRNEGAPVKSVARAAGIRRLFRLPNALRPAAREVEDELRFHLESRTADLVARGMPPAEARRIAETEFGDLEASRAELTAVDRRIRRRQRRADVLDVLRQDAAYAARGLRRDPSFACTIVVTLALAIGANAAVFSVVDPLLFRLPPGISDASSVRRLYPNHPHAPNAVNGRAVGQRFSYPEYRAIAANLTGSARVAAYRVFDSTVVRTAADTLAATVGYATADFLPMLEVRLQVGRTFTPLEDDIASPVDVAVVSARFARRVFGSEAAAIGRALAIGDKPFTVIGVAALFEGVDFAAVDVWAPFSAQPRAPVRPNTPPWYVSHDRYLPLVTRLLPGASDALVESRATAAYRSASPATRPSEAESSVLTGPLVENRGPGVPRQEVAISTKLAAVALIVFVIACANVVNLFLARALRRRRELAVRLALGVTRARLASQLLTESALLALIAGVVAVVVALWAGSALRTALLPRVDWIAPAIGLRVLWFTLACTAIASLAAAIVPAALSRRLVLTDALSGDSRWGGAGRSRLRSGLLVVQTALSVTLAVAAMLFVRSLAKVRDIDVGYRGNVLIASLRYDDAKRHPELSTLVPEEAERIARRPGVAGAAYASGAPLYKWYSEDDLFQQGSETPITGEGSKADHIAVSSDYFSVAGTPLVSGRTFDASDTQYSPPVMVVSRSTAEALWPNESPLGKCVIPAVATKPCYMIIGVVADAHELHLVEASKQQFYVSISQPVYAVPPDVFLVRMGARTASVAAVASDIRRELANTFPDARVSVRAVDDILAPQVEPWRLGTQLFVSLALLAFVVAVVGVYSVVAFNVRERTRELAIRAALGARAGDLLRSVLLAGTGLVGIGIVIGIAGALACGQLIASLLYGVSARDPGAMSAAAAALLGAGMLATAIPAWRASRIDPASVLRDE